MPYTVVAFLWRKPGTTPSEFRSHYENNHIPLVLSLAGPVFPQSHTRFYLTRTSTSDSSSSDTTKQTHNPTVFMGTPDDFDYDVWAELVFKDAAAWEAFYMRMGEPEVAAKIGEDEERFVDRKKFKVAAVDEPMITTRPSQ